MGVAEAVSTATAPVVSTKAVGHPAIPRVLRPYLALPIWIFLMVFGAVWLPLSLLLLPVSVPAAVLSLTLLAVAMAVPLQVRTPEWAAEFFRFCFRTGVEFFPTRFHYVDRAALEESAGPFVIGYEPHSVLPQSITYFSKYGSESTSQVAPVFAKARVLVSSAGFWAPLTRHLWWWLGCRPVSRSVFAKLLARGNSVALCPGGVQECIYMGPGVEVVYLRRRHGFVRLAIQNGAPLVPVFAFGQTFQFRYLRFFIDWPRNLIPRAKYLSFVRRIGYVPMLIFGLFGSPMPRRVPIDIVVGKPIEVPRVANPSQELVQEYLDKFIDAMETIFNDYREQLGHGDLTLKIY